MGSDPHHAAYPPIADYAFISDCRSGALVSSAGSIDWCCMPQLNFGSCFGRLLDWQKGGYCSLRALDEEATAARAYVDGTLVLRTELHTGGGEVAVYDCFTVDPQGGAEPAGELLRVIEGVRGRVALRLDIVPRFDYGEVRPWIRHQTVRVYNAIGGNDALVITANAELAPTGEHELGADLELRGDARIAISMRFVPPERLDEAVATPADPDELHGRLRATIEWWRRWSRGGSLGGPDGAGALRSALVLKGLTHAPTGAMAAAATTSLPEAAGGERNWDYRFSWVRDSSFAVRSLASLGFAGEADAFRQFIQRSSAGSAEELQVLYGLRGERRLNEVELDLEGYRGARPVRAGNGAARQLQLDVYGHLLELSWRWHRRGHSPEDDYWRFVLNLVDAAAARWSEPDRGIWEMRGKPRHYVHSKAMCWAALDRGLLLAKECMRKAPERRWRRARDEIRAAIERDGYDERRGIFVQSFGGRELDAALLLLPTVGFVAWDDERMVRTTDAVREELDDDGLVRRYQGRDGLRGEEGAFLACSFWLVECLARQDRFDEARAAFDRAVACGNDLGLFSEEYDPRRGEMLGNFPQGLTHLSHIAAAAALAGVE